MNLTIEQIEEKYVQYKEKNEQNEKKIKKLNDEIDEINKMLEIINSSEDAIPMLREQIIKLNVQKAYETISNEEQEKLDLYKKTRTYIENSQENPKETLEKEKKLREQRIEYLNNSNKANNRIIGNIINVLEGKEKEKQKDEKKILENNNNIMNDLEPIMDELKQIEEKIEEYKDFNDSGIITKEQYDELEKLKQKRDYSIEKSNAYLRKYNNQTKIKNYSELIHEYNGLINIIDNSVEINKISELKSNIKNYIEIQKEKELEKEIEEIIQEETPKENKSDIEALLEEYSNLKTEIEELKKEKINPDLVKILELTNRQNQINKEFEKILNITIPNYINTKNSEKPIETNTLENTEEKDNKNEEVFPYENYTAEEIFDIIGGINEKEEQKENNTLDNKEQENNNEINTTFQEAEKNNFKNEVNAQFKPYDEQESNDIENIIVEPLEQNKNDNNDIKDEDNKEKEDKDNAYDEKKYLIYLIDSERKYHEKYIDSGLTKEEEAAWKNITEQIREIRRKVNKPIVAQIKENLKPEYEEYKNRNLASKKDVLVRKYKQSENFPHAPKEEQQAENQESTIDLEALNSWLQDQRKENNVNLEQEEQQGKNNKEEQKEDKPVYYRNVEEALENLDKDEPQQEQPKKRVPVYERNTNEALRKLEEMPEEELREVKIGDPKKEKLRNEYLNIADQEKIVKKVKRKKSKSSFFEKLKKVAKQVGKNLNTPITFGSIEEEEDIYNSGRTR